MPLTYAEIELIRERYPHLRNYESEELDAPIDPMTFLDPTGDSLLHIAAREGDLSTVQMLVRAGIDVNRAGDMGSTALHYARMKRRDSVFDYLVASGASRLIRNEFGQLPDEV